MNDSKVWLVLGAEDGLGAAAIKYLIAKKQTAIALIVNEAPCIRLLKEDSENLHVINIRHFSRMELNIIVTNLLTQHGSINTIINNLNYRLFNQLPSGHTAYLQSEIENCISNTIEIIKVFLPLACTEPLVHLINVPPQLCLATLPDTSDAETLSQRMDLFLERMQTALSKLHCRLDFLQPGARLSELSDTQ
jgi:hypothetical protein